MKHCCTIKNSKLEPFVGKCMHTETTVLNEISPIHKVKFIVSPI